MGFMGKSSRLEMEWPRGGRSIFQGYTWMVLFLDISSRINVLISQIQDERLFFIVISFGLCDIEMYSTYSIHLCHFFFFFSFSIR